MRLARDLAPEANDVMIWLGFENMRLLTLVEGDSSLIVWRSLGLIVWRSLGNLSTDAFAMGLHREHSHKTTPFFLAEGRRKTFASAYQSDKAFATFFDRPPRIPKIYADCKLPLDLADHQILYDNPSALDQARSNLTEDGWSTEKGYRSATWARIRFILAQFREEIIQYGLNIDSTPEKIRNLLQRCETQWGSVPAHIRYSGDCWDSDTPAGACFMLGKVYLSYLHIKLQIHRLLARTDPSFSPGMLQISGDMLQTVLQIANARDRAMFWPRDLSTVILAYGLPCATTLATALQDAVRVPPHSLPLSLNHATLIRNLSVFVPHLENLCRPRDANYLFCAQASKAISRTLDEFLSSLASPNNARPTSPGETDSRSPVLPQASIPTSLVATTLADFSTVDCERLETFDFADWSTNVNWNTVEREWDIF